MTETEGHPEYPGTKPTVTPKDSVNTCAAGARLLMVIFFLWLSPHACEVLDP